MSADSMNAEERADYFVTYCVRASMVWGLKNDQGWHLRRSPEGREIFPAWPTRDSAAQAAAEGESPEAIALDEWMGQWLPGLGADGRHVAIHPVGNDGLIADPADLLAEFEDEIEEMGG